jgi:hypothetical protein
VLCRWLFIGPAYSLAAVAMALVVTPEGSGLLCRIVTICHHCI